MTKDPKPMGIKKWKKTLKTQFRQSCEKYAKQLETELRAVYENPDTVIGKLSVAYNGVQAANQRLSALCACLIKAGGGKVTFSKEELEAFKGMAINIKWELPEGVEKPEEATSFVFSYDAVPQAELEKMQAAQAAAAHASEGQAPTSAQNAAQQPPVPATGDSTFVAADNPADTVPSGTAFPEEVPPPPEAVLTGPAGYVPPVSQ